MMKKVVVKIGSSVIAPEGRLDSSLINRIVKDIFKAEEEGFKIVLISSGAIACGLNVLGHKRKPGDIHSLMAISSLGQIALMDIYADKFKKQNKLCAQILLTWDDFDNRKRFLNARYTIDKLFNMGITPIINENDAVSCDEIKFGDNDCLSALVGDLLGAEILIMLSDVEGLIGEDNKVIGVVPCIDSKILRLAKKKGKTHTAGGMLTKLEAAKIAVSSGITTVIADGRRKSVVSDIVKGKRVGTLFMPSRKIGEARKRWIAFSKKIKGRIYIDQGAKNAVVNRGKSLLGVGIVKIEGEFKRKDAVEVFDIDNVILGCGLVNYSHEELREHKAKKFEREVIHRDNFVKVIEQMTD